MKIIILITFLLSLFACINVIQNKNKFITESLEQVPELNLPFKVQCLNFSSIRNLEGINYRLEKEDNPLQTSSYFGKISGKIFDILIKDIKIEKSPILYTISSDGKILDSLIMFERNPYIGVDSDCLPRWVEITHDFRIIISDTSRSSTLHITGTHYDKKTNTHTVSGFTDSTINKSIFKINNDGKITTIK